MAFVSGIGCRQGGESLAPADASYEVMGTVQRLGGRQKQFDEVVVRHQSVDDFRNRDGEVVGMDSMAMPFAILPTLGLEELVVGDPVRIRFEVRWESEPVLLITELSKLPDGTVVSFEEPTDAPVEGEGFTEDAASTDDAGSTDEAGSTEDLGSAEEGSAVEEPSSSSPPSNSET